MEYYEDDAVYTTTTTKTEKEKETKKKKQIHKIKTCWQNQLKSLILVIMFILKFSVE